MAEKHLYIIAGPNGAGKTTASYSVLPKILQCREFVNADEIARGLSPFNPESVAIERVAERVSKGGHNIPRDIIVRRYYEGIDNLSRIYMPIVDTWVLVDNSVTPRGIIATGGLNQQTIINDEVEFKKIESYVKQ